MADMAVTQEPLRLPEPQKPPSEAWRHRNIDATAKKIQEDVDKAELATVERYNSHRTLGNAVAEAERRAQAEARLEASLRPYSGDARAKNPLAVPKDCTMCQGTGKVTGWFNSNQSCWKCKGSGSETQPGA